MRYLEKVAEENWDYLKSLMHHKYTTYKAMRELGLPFWQSVGHDLDKLNPLLFVPYRDFFYGKGGLRGTRDPEVKAKFYAAAQLHRSRNPHHFFTTGMPSQNNLNSKLEAVADWYSANERRLNFPENYPDLPTWWNQNKMKYQKKIGSGFVAEVDKRLEKKSALTAFDVLAGLGGGAMVGHIVGSQVKADNEEVYHTKKPYLKGFLVGAPFGTAAGIYLAKNLDLLKKIKVA